MGTVLDVGTADGTPELYQAFPEAGLVLFDPLVEQLERAAASLGGRPAQRFAMALGSAPGHADLTVTLGNLLKSSLNPRTALTAEPGAVERRTVEIRTLDEVAAEQGWADPLVLKIDTEGHELEVLQGAAQTLARCAVVYCETSLGRRFEGGYGFSEVARVLLDAGFELVDVVAAPRGPDGRVVFLDGVWVRPGATTTGPAAARSEAVTSQ